VFLAFFGIIIPLPCFSLYTKSLVAFQVTETLDSRRALRPPIDNHHQPKKGEYVNLVGKGIIDPTKVVRSALQNAASIAGLLITTEAMVAEAPKKQGGAPAMPPGGGMGGMDY